MTKFEGVLKPGGTIGILGGGQLGKMTIAAAHRLGYDTVVWGLSENDPGVRAATHKIVGPLRRPQRSADLDVGALDEFDHAFNRFANLADVVTFDWENVDVEIPVRLDIFRPVRPGWKVLSIANDRSKEKQLFAHLKIPTPRNHVMLWNGEPLSEDFPFPAILKTLCDGYDGKGQVHILERSGLEEAWASLDHKPCILEERLDFLCEASIIVARSSITQRTMLFPILENEHRNGILAVTRCPAPNVSKEAGMEMRRYAIGLARELRLDGLLAIEFFVMKNGRVLANEMAPRPHNSGHGTIEGNTVSQFEQHIRAICGLKLHRSDLRCPWVMENLIGNDIERAIDLLEVPGAHVHIYGKGETRLGRKMGHVTFLK